MNYLSVCSGIEAATVAWHDMGFNPVGFSEIEPFPAAALQHHYPNVPNFGDMTKFKEWNLDPNTVDLLVGGTPCQSFSVAGLRKGLDDPRGNLALVYCSMLDYFRPKWFVWENVPGVLSSSGGRDFGSFLGAVAELGYGFSYRVLDAQYFGVAQRRRRVFVVGHLGNWQRPAAVLFERNSLRRDTAPSRAERKDVAGPITAGINKGCRGTEGVESNWAVPVSYGIPGNWIGRKPENGGNAVEPMHDVSPCLTKTDRHGVAQPVAFRETADCLTASYGTKWNGNASANNGSLFAGQPVACIGGLHPNAALGDDQCPTLTSAMGMGGGHIPAVTQPVAYAFDSLSSNSMKSANPNSGCNQVEVSKTLDTSRGLDPSCNQGGIGVAQPVVAPSLTASNNPSRSPQSSEVTQQIAAVHAASMAVRRLTPVECERLQGFPDNYTNIPWRKSVESPDGPRYKALGNSMAVPVMRWIGQQIQQIEDIK